MVANFHGSETLKDVKVRIPQDARALLGQGESWRFTDRLDTDWSAAVSPESLETDGLSLPELPPCSALILEITGGAP